MKRNLFHFALLLSASILLAACGGQQLGESITADTTVENATIAAGETLTLENGAQLRVTGELVVEGTLQSSGGPLNLVVEGSLLLNGTLRSEEDVESLPGGPDSAGIRLLVLGDVEFGPQARIETNGHLIITDDEAQLARSPQEIADEADSASGDLPTLVPLPPDDPAFEEEARLPGQKVGQLAPRALGALPPILIGGEVDLRHFPGDQRIILLRFKGARDLFIAGLKVSGPPAPAGETDAPDVPEGESGDAKGGNGKNGMRLNIWNTNGNVNIQNSTFNLTDGGDGGDAFATCGKAEGGAGGKSGNMRITSGISISVTSVTINPGRSGDGGDAYTDCDVPGGDAEEAIGGPGGDNTKRLHARGNVSIDDLTIGPLIAGDGGDADAFAADGADGVGCEDGQDGGWASAEGGKGGDASLSVSGLPATVSEVRAGNGGDATAVAGDGGNGGFCLCGSTEGGLGGLAFAFEGIGGKASGGSPSTDGQEGESDETDGEDGIGQTDICAEGTFLFDQGDLEGALALFDQAVAENPAEAEVYFRRGVVRFELGDYEGALDDFLTALELDPDVALIYYGAAISYDALGDPQAALHFFETFVGLYHHDNEIRQYALQRIQALGGTLPEGEVPPTSTPQPQQDGGGSEADFSVSGSFAHTQPGVQSEVYVDIRGEPGASVSATLSGPGVKGSSSKSGTIGADGRLRLTWTIDQFGSYTASGTVGGQSFSTSINVQ